MAATPTVRKEMPLSSGDGRQRLAPTFTGKLERPNRVETKIWELDLSQYLAGEGDEEWNINGQYAQANCSYRHAEYADLLLNVPSDEDFFLDKLDELEQWGCTAEFIALYREAHAAEVRFLLFWC
jgi:hypothetical protein